MTIKQKNELIAAVIALLERMIPVYEPELTTITVSKSALPEMLNVKGLTEHIV